MRVRSPPPPRRSCEGGARSRGWAPTRHRCLSRGAPTGLLCRPCRRRLAPQAARLQWPCECVVAAHRDRLAVEPTHGQVLRARGPCQQSVLAGTDAGRGGHLQVGRFDRGQVVGVVAGVEFHQPRGRAWRGGTSVGYEVSCGRVRAVIFGRAPPAPLPATSVSRSPLGSVVARPPSRRSIAAWTRSRSTRAACGTSGPEVGR